MSSRVSAPAASVWPRWSESFPRRTPSRPALVPCRQRGLYREDACHRDGL